jgi:hypothetical protein
VAPRLLNLRQAAAYLGCSFWSVRDWILGGLIPTVTLPPLRPREGERPRANLRRVLVDIRDLDAFIEQRKPPSAPDIQSGARGNTPGNTARIRGSVPAVCPEEAG